MYGSIVTNRWMILIVVGLSLAVLDQGTKFLAIKYLTPGLVKAKLGKGVDEQVSTQELESVRQEMSFFESLSYFYRHPKHPCILRLSSQCPTHPVIEGFWNHRYVENPGGAWGLLADSSEQIRAPFFLIVSIGALIFIIGFFRQLEEHQKLMILSLSLVFGGALGNLIDRLHLSYVIDFIDWHVGDWHWPTFNIADAGITIGVILLLVEWARDAISSRKPEKSNSGNQRFRIR